MSSPAMNTSTPEGSPKNFNPNGLSDGPKATPLTTTATDDDQLGISHTASKETSNPPAWRRKRRFTMLPNAHLEPRPFTNKYFFKRPRLLQYYDRGALIDSQGHRLTPPHPDDDLVLSPSTNGGVVSDAETDPATASVPEAFLSRAQDVETGKLQRDWLNLFIDLLWVGIVSNISSSFVSSAFETPASNTWGYAFLEFIVLFQTAFRFWSYIRKFLNNFFNKDFSQSLFLTWVLVLALFFGNQTPYFLDGKGNTWIIGTFLVAKGSFVLVEGVYCWFIPSLRREFRVTFVIAIPAAALWSASVVVPWPTQAALILPAVMLEGLISAIMSLPLGHKYLLRGAPKKALDPDNFVERLQGFFIIVLGEGVFGLISTGGSGWDVGLTIQVVSAIEALIVYYLLFWMFFTGDQTKTYIHAMYRNRYTSLAFQLYVCFCFVASIVQLVWLYMLLGTDFFGSVHVLLFGTILLLDASIKYLIENSLAEDKYSSLLLARWTISASLTGTLLLLTVKALLNRSMDPPGTLVIDSRYLRMAPRAIVCIVTMCLPIINDFNTTAFLGTLVGQLQLLILWELVAAMEKGFRFFEPKEA
jgi:hypothetical protein